MTTKLEDTEHPRVKLNRAHCRWVAFTSDGREFNRVFHSFWEAAAFADQNAE